MFKYKVNEYEEGGTAYYNASISFLGIPIYKKDQKTTNINIVKNLHKPDNKLKKKIGF